MPFLPENFDILLYFTALCLNIMMFFYAKKKNLPGSTSFH